MSPRRGIVFDSPGSPSAGCPSAGTAGAGEIRGEMGRREFLALGASWTVVSWLGGSGGLAVAAARQAEGVPVSAPLSVGYVERSDLFSGFDTPPWEKALELEGERAEVETETLEVYPATELPAGDPSFGWESAEITVFGLYPPPAAGRRRGLRRAALEVGYRLEDPTVATPVPFLAWAYEREPVENEGSAIRFVAPVDRELGLSLVLYRESLATRRAQRQSGPAATSLRADFTVNLERGRPKLQRGVYLLGLRRGLFDRPVTLPDPDEVEASRYEALVLSIDHVPR